MKWFVVTLSTFNKAFVKKAIERGCVRVQLNERDVHLYCPTIKKFCNGQLVEEALYEGYCFIGLPKDVDEVSFFLAFTDLVHFIRVLTKVVSKEVNGKVIDVEVPYRVDKNIVSLSRERCEGFSVRRKKVFNKDLKVGDRVEVVRGAFKGFEGDVMYIEKYRKDVFLRVFFLGTYVQIQVERIDLEKINVKQKKLEEN